MIGSLLASAGITLFNNLIENHGNELVAKGIEKVTGLKLEDKVKAQEPLTEQEKALIIESSHKIKDAIFADIQSARETDIKLATNDKTPIWVKLNRTLTGQVTIVLCFTLFFYVLTNGVDIQNSNVALIVGAAIGYVSQILSFLFGSTEEKHTFQK